MLAATSRHHWFITEPGVIWDWADAMDSGAVDLFVSDGDPSIVTVPEGWEGALDEDRIAEGGRRIVIETWAGDES